MCVCVLTDEYKSKKKGEELSCAIVFTTEVLLVKLDKFKDNLASLVSPINFFNSSKVQNLKYNCQ